MREPDWPNLQIEPSDVLRHVWSSSLIGLTFIDEEGCWVNPSPNLCELLEYTAAELESMKFSAVTHPQDIKPDWEMAKRVARGEIEHYEMTKRYITKSGKTVWVRLHVSGFFAADDKFLMYLSQIAPAVTWDPRAPTVRSIIPLETRIVRFVKQNWKWLAPVTLAVLGAAARLYVQWTALMNGLDQ